MIKKIRITADSVIKGYRYAKIVMVDYSILDPAWSQSVYNHSPDGFNWGYGGSGPAQLALALLLLCAGEKEALEHYQDFKNDIVSRLTDDDFVLSGSDIITWMEDNSEDEEKE